MRHLFFESCPTRKSDLVRDCADQAKKSHDPAPVQMELYPNDAPIGYSQTNGPGTNIW